MTFYLPLVKTPNIKNKLNEKIYKILTVVGTRPEIIKLSSVIKKFDKYFNHVLVHTGQNYDYTLNEIFFKEFNLKTKVFPKRCWIFFNSNNFKCNFKI